ncbi:MAG TPA: response regulator [Thermoanaerobaculia bacterium]
MCRKKILLVDDSTVILMMEKYILRNGPYILLAASNGEEAVELAISEQPDLIVLDASMPHMSGFEACRRISADEASKHIPIILVTTPGEDGSGDGTETSGCIDTLSKPIKAGELLAKVRTLLDDGEAGAE